MKKRIFALAMGIAAVGSVLAAMDEKQIAEGLRTHDRALHIKDGWIRDPYIYLAPDGAYYLTGTTPLPEDPRQGTDPYNTGLGPQSIVGYKMVLWKSTDLIHWQDMGTPYSLEDGIWYQARRQQFQKDDKSNWRLWAPEIQFWDDRWVIVHTSPSPVAGANLSVTLSKEFRGPFANPLGEQINKRHDPSLFCDTDRTLWMVYGATNVIQIKSDLSGFEGSPADIGPSNRKIGHEGCLIRKIGSHYVLFGTGWSTDQGRHGTYNLYYCTAPNVTGPYGPRRFAGRFLGHGTPFQDKAGQWWCTAFYNANVPPLSREELKTKPMGDNAYTINPQGVTIVPLEVEIRDDGQISIRARDPDYAHPGPEEVQQFE